MFGYSAVEMIGKRPVTVLHDPAELAALAQEGATRHDCTGESEVDTLIRDASQGGVHKREWTLIRKDGHRFPALVSTVALHQDSGAAGGILGVAIDLSDRRQAEADLIAARQVAEHANQTKSRFLAAASHDLRQPLAALSLYLSVLQSRLPSHETELMSNIQECMSGLSGLLTDLLDISKLDAGVVQPALSDFAIDELLINLGAIHFAEARLKGLQLRTRPSALIVHTDRKLLHRMLGNLIANAVRYTNTGGVLVGCRRHQGKWWVEIWDSGIGIPADKTRVIFEEFRQLGDDSRTRGSGLGLAIVAKSCALLGLAIRVGSRPGKGSMFAVELPQGVACPPLVLPLARQDGQLLRIGLVDDNEQLLQAMVLALEQRGHAVVAGASGAQFFDLIGGQSPDVLISDYRLTEGETGFDVIAEARTRFGAGLPALIITGDTDPKLIREMSAQGISVLYKPLDLDALLQSVHQQVAKSGAAELEN
jgi:PAS domain S-box-containing protein